MNSNWRNRPTTIDYVNKDITHVIFIDESGSPNLKQALKAKQKNKPMAETDRHFTVTACLVKMTDFDTAKEAVMDLKNKYWENALYEYKGVKKRVCFHSRDIRRHTDAFSTDLIDYDGFVADLSAMMASVPITIYASHIDKQRHVNQYIYPDPPYDLCMTFVLERIMRNLTDNDSCIIVLEARGTDEDLELLKHIKRFVDYGSTFCPASATKKIKGVYFNPKWCKSKNEQMSYWGLELADLCAYPIQKNFVYGKKDKAFETLETKIACYPNYWGKGLKSFPKT